MTDGLKFNALRGANKARLPQFKNKHGQLSHTEMDGSDWTPAQWLQAVLGELGEYANMRKKFERGDIALAKELADVQIYLDILALRCLDSRMLLEGGQYRNIPHREGVNLGQATMDKFNEVSERVGSSVRLEADDWHYVK